MGRQGKFHAAGGLRLGDLKTVYTNATGVGYSDEALVNVETIDVDFSNPQLVGPDVVVTVTEGHPDPADDLSAASDPSGPETTTTARS